MAEWSFSLENRDTGQFSSQNHTLLTVPGFLTDPELAVHDASLQKFAKITPQYPGIRAPLKKELLIALTHAVSTMLSEAFEETNGTWSIMGWYSLVTTPPSELQPIQRLPHVDGTDPRQVAMMLYMHDTDHGGTAFFRHKSTGYEALTDENFPAYRQQLQADVAQSGMPPALYTDDGEPLFERTHQIDGQFNEAAFYRGNILHSGIIDNHAPLSDDPRKGRLTINAFLRPPGA